MKVNGSNYFVATAAEFRSIPAKWTALLLGGKDVVKLGNMAFHKTHTSVGRYGSMSVYWEDADGSTLVRVSDHWCGQGSTRAAVLCPSIRSCLWKLRGKVHPVMHYGLEMSGGIVRFRDMRQLEP